MLFVVLSLICSFSFSRCVPPTLCLKLSYSLIFSLKLLCLTLSLPLCLSVTLSPSLPSALALSLFPPLSLSLCVCEWCCYVHVHLWYMFEKHADKCNLYAPTNTYIRAHTNIHTYVRLYVCIIYAVIYFCVCVLI